MKNYEEAQKHFLSRWLCGLTCRGSCRQAIQWWDETGRFILMVHHSHASYVGRMSGSVCCKVYRSLYDLEKVTEDTSVYPEKYMKKWEGRWKESNMKEVEEIIRNELAKESLSGNA
jgi:hypothetical protein